MRKNYVKILSDDYVCVWEAKDGPRVLEYNSPSALWFVGKYTGGRKKV